MNADENFSPESCTAPSSGADPLPFLQRTDWLSFAVTSLLMFCVYWFTLSPSVDLNFSGVFATGALYPGISFVPGYPLWTGYTWLFTVCLPISNIAWRVSVASAVAASLACGIVALLTSRCGGILLGDVSGRKTLEPVTERKLRLVCGCVAGMALGLDGAFWRKVVVADPESLSILLLTITVSLLLRWQHAPEKTRWFHAAMFTFGLTLTNSQAIAPAALGIELFILCVKPRLARDVFAATTLLMIFLLLGDWFHFGMEVGALFRMYLAIGIFTLLGTIYLTVTARRFFTEWKTVLIGGMVFMFGLTPYLLLPALSMTDPPMNWSYPRTYDGFLHLITRGQMAGLWPTDSLARFAECLNAYLEILRIKLGFIYMFAAVIPFLFLPRFDKPLRRLLLGLLFLFFSLSLFLLYLMNPSPDAGSVELTAHFFDAANLILCILAGCGLTLLGSRLTSVQAAKSSSQAIAGKPNS
jgi:hypothetical protein